MELNFYKYAYAGTKPLPIHYCLSLRPRVLRLIEVLAVLPTYLLVLLEKSLDSFSLCLAA